MVAFNELEGPSAHSSILCPVHTDRNGPFLGIPSLFLHLHISLHLSFSCGKEILNLFQKLAREYGKIVFSMPEFWEFLFWN